MIIHTQKIRIILETNNEQEKIYDNFQMIGGSEMIDDIIAIVADVAEIFIDVWINKITRRKKNEDEKSKLEGQKDER